MAYIATTSKLRISSVSFDSHRYSWLRLSLTHTTTAFPLSFMVITDLDIKLITSLEKYLRTISTLPQTLHVQQINKVAEYPSCKTKLTREWSFWAVLSGNGEREFISSRW
jgi:hypothetical protein